MPHRHRRQRVAVARRLGDNVGCHDAIGASAVVGDHHLPPSLLHVLTNRARQQVGRATGSKGNHHADLLLGIGALRAGDRWKKGRRSEAPEKNRTLHCR